MDPINNKPFPDLQEERRSNLAKGRVYDEKKLVSQGASLSMIHFSFTKRY